MKYLRKNFTKFSKYLKVIRQFKFQIGVIQNQKIKAKSFHKRETKLKI